MPLIPGGIVPYTGGRGLGRLDQQQPGASEIIP